MKFLVVFAVTVACAAAADVSAYIKTDDVPIIRSSYDSSPEGKTFQYAYETGNGIYAEAQGVVKDFESKEPSLEIRGSYKYFSPDGTPVETTYVAGELGFVPSGAHLPVPPPIPELILRGLAYTEAHRPSVEKGYKP